jgi:hypothetical protein
MMFVASLMCLMTPIWIIWGFNQNFTESKRGSWWWMGWVFFWQAWAVGLFWLAPHV